MTVSVSIHEAKSQLSGLLAQMAKDGTPIVICNRGRPVADLCPHRMRNRIELHPHMSQIEIKYDPTEPLQEDEWPMRDQ